MVFIYSPGYSLSHVIISFSPHPGSDSSILLSDDYLSSFGLCVSLLFIVLLGDLQTWHFYLVYIICPIILVTPLSCPRPPWLLILTALLSIFSVPAAPRQMCRESRSSLIINSWLITISGLSVVLSSSITFLCWSCSTIWSNFHSFGQNKTLSSSWPLSIHHPSLPNRNQIFMIYLLKVFQISLLFSISYITTLV